MAIPHTVEFQGDIVRQRTLGAVMRGQQKTRRGKVTAFSKKSRRRLLEYLARTEKDTSTKVFLTLTYPSNMTDSMRGKAHLRAFLERVRRRWPQAACIWRIEYQERGAVHFHLLFFGLPYWKADNIRQVWGEIIGERNPWIHIATCRSRKKTIFYVSKYIAKTPSTAEVSLSNLPYLHEGRHWGVFNRAGVPMAVLKVFEVLGDLKAFWDLRRAIDRYYPKRKKSYAGGAMLFSQNAAEWERYWKFLTNA